MKTNLSILTIFVVFFCGCDSAKEPEIIQKEEISFVGQTFSGYSFTSVIDKSKMYNGYRFISKDSVTELLLTENSHIVSQSNHKYTLNYPKIDIQGINTKDGFWHGEFIDENTLQVRNILMKKW